MTTNKRQRETCTAEYFEEIVQDGIANYIDSQGGTEAKWRPVVEAYLRPQYEITTDEDFPQSCPACGQIAGLCICEAPKETNNMTKFTVSCTVTYRRTWTDIEAENAAEAQTIVFEDGCDIEHDEDLIDGPSFADDMHVEEQTETPKETK